MTDMTSPEATAAFRAIGQAIQASVDDMARSMARSMGLPPPSERGYVGNRSGWYPHRPRHWHA